LFSFKKRMAPSLQLKWNQAGRTLSPIHTTKRSDGFLRKTTRRSRVHVQTIGLNAETKKLRHRVDAALCLLTFPFIGLVRFPRLSGPDSVVVTSAQADCGIVRRPQKLATAAVSVGYVSNTCSSRAISNACLKFGPRLQSLRPPPLAFVFRCISMGAPRPALFFVGEISRVGCCSFPVLQSSLSSITSFNANTGIAIQ
jgi:hypothetical protein